LWEAFLIQMDDFDRFLEFELRQMLDPVVVSGPPRRRTRKKANDRPLLTVIKAPFDLALEAAVEPVPVPVRPLSFPH
jgi:hypothetical protein